jgi:hypothetical protein
MRVSGSSTIVQAAAANSTAKAVTANNTNPALPPRTSRLETTSNSASSPYAAAAAPQKPVRNSMRGGTRSRSNPGNAASSSKGGKNEPREYTNVARIKINQTAHLRRTDLRLHANSTRAKVTAPG